VSDGNTYAMGGISGHAGVFSTVGDLANFAKNLLSSLLNVDTDASENSLLNTTTLELFTALYNSSQSSRALGWDTNSFTVITFILFHFLSF
jgi:CubicO group peptidase (beta-lactamase class C family)